MKRIFGVIALLFPLFCGAISAPIEVEVIRTEETPGFFAVTIFPSKEANPMRNPVVFVKNFDKTDSAIYAPIVNFLTELGANVIDTPKKIENAHVISLGNPLPDSENFSSHNAQKSLEEFETFSLQNLKPVFFKNLRAEFGGNISDVVQSDETTLDEKGVTFVGKFEKDMRTRMAIIADTENDELQFVTPLDLTNKNLSLSPIAHELPQLWERLQNKHRMTENIMLSFFPWIIGGTGILFLILVIAVYRHKNVSKEKEFSLQSEIPWHTVSAKENKPSNPFEVS